MKQAMSKVRGSGVEAMSGVMCHHEAGHVKGQRAWGRGSLAACADNYNTCVPQQHVQCLCVLFLCQH